VSPEIAPALGQLIERHTGQQVRYASDPYYTLTRSVARFRKPEVRMLSAADCPLLACAPEEFRGSGWTSLHKMLSDGGAAGAVIGGRLVATAYVSALTRQYADISVGTLAEARGKGLATAAASLLVEHVQARGRIPVWTTAEDNAPAQRIREKLGFVESTRLTVIRLRPTSRASDTTGLSTSRKGIGSASIQRPPPPSRLHGRRTPTPRARRHL
jgi:GNAT superfamily N-acetyltransferase